MFQTKIKMEKAETKALRGLGVALVTPFRQGRVDYDALAGIVDYVIAGGVDYLVSLGTTGEAPAISAEERADILRATAEANRGRLPLVVGLGGNDTQGLIRALSACPQEGLTAILSSSPAYNTPTQGGIYEHYRAFSEASPLPVILYNVPSRTASNMEADTCLRLAHDCDNIIGIKEAGTDFDQMSRILKHRPKDFLVISGNDSLALPLLSLGGDGLISVIANALPAQFSRMLQAALEGDFKTAADIHLRHSDIHPWLYADGNPAGVKAALDMMQLCGPETRLPLLPASPETREGLKQALLDANALLPDDAIA